jgi:hypothetical protein
LQQQGLGQGPGQGPGQQEPAGSARAAGTPSAAAAAAAPVTAAGAPGAAAAASAGWVESLLPLLPPASLTAGGLLAVWQGCGLHEVVPPDMWLAQASWVMARYLQARKLDFNDMAGLLQVCVWGGGSGEGLLGDASYLLL